MRLSEIFSDGLVLQAGKPIRIFGTGGGRAIVTLNGLTSTGIFNQTNWCLELPALDYGGPFELVCELDGRVKTVKDVYVGDVYLLAGQSNMQFKLRESDLPRETYRSHANVRLFSTERPEGGETFLPEDGWVTLTSENAGNWPCIGYIVGDFMAGKRDTMIGFVTCYQGAADIQSFMPREIFEEDKTLDLPDCDRFDMDYSWNKGTSVLYEYMFKKLVPFSFKAVVFYQGESNCALPESRIYGRLLKLMIESWRRDLKDENLRFVIVEIADYVPRLGEAWTNIQKAQTEAGRTIHNVVTVKSSDVCERDLIHPTKKTELGRRIFEAIG